MPPGEGGTPIHYLYRYVPPNGVMILKLLIYNRYPFQRCFLERGIIFNKMGNKKNCASQLYLLLKIVADYEEAFI